MSDYNSSSDEDWSPSDVEEPTLKELNPEAYIELTSIADEWLRLTGRTSEHLEQLEDEELDQVVDEFRYFIKAHHKGLHGAIKTSKDQDCYEEALYDV